jgi:DNA-directed RNA polymerase specialized sigma subunit
VEHQAELDRQAGDLRDERDEAIREAYREDLPMKAISEVLHMSHQRVSQIVRS